MGVELELLRYVKNLLLPRFVFLLLLLLLVVIIFARVLRWNLCQLVRFGFFLIQAQLTAVPLFSLEVLLGELQDLLVRQLFALIFIIL